MRTKVLVPLSGGQDSALVLTKLQAFDKYEVIPIFFDYGQSHVEELKAAEFWADKYDLELQVINTVRYKDYLSTIKPADYHNHTMIHRNLLFLILCHSYCVLNKVPTIALGCNKDDVSLHNDCNAMLLNIYMTLLNESANADVDLYLPFKDKNKVQMLEIANHLGILPEYILETRTCYKTGSQQCSSYATGYGCGLCNACRLREQAYSTFMLKHRDMSEELERGLDDYFKNQLRS